MDNTVLLVGIMGHIQNFFCTSGMTPILFWQGQSDDYALIFNGDTLIVFHCEQS